MNDYYVIIIIPAHPKICPILGLNMSLMLQSDELARLAQ